MQRRSFRVIGSEGTVDVELERLPGGTIDVHETDDMGRPVQGSYLAHSWDDARSHAGELIKLAITEGRI